jgi:hypothetical protein
MERYSMCDSLALVFGRRKREGATYHLQAGYQQRVEM